MKKRISIFVLLFSLIIGSSSVYASEDVLGLPKGDQDFSKDKLLSIEKIDNELKQIGIPNDLLSEISFEKKQSIISENPIGFYTLASKEFYIDESGEMKELIKNSDEYTTYKTIPRADLKMTTSVINYGRIKGRQTYTLIYQWSWQKTTSFAWTDRVALSYNDEFQTRIDNNGDYRCSSTSYKEGSTLPPLHTDCGGRLADVTFGGASWNYDIKLGELNSGTVTMDIETKATNKPGNLITLAKYYHKTGFPGGLSLNIGYNSISVTSGSGYDEVAEQGTKSYK